VAKIDLSKIVSEMQSLYAKDKKAKAIIATGDHVRVIYTEKDVIPLPASHPLRIVLGLPGIPFNKIVQVAGRADSGKSTLAAEAIVSAQKSGAQVLLLDSEDKFDANRLTSMGGDPSQILVARTNEILKGAELVRKYINAIKAQDPEAKILFIWDSVGGSQSRSHSERELDSEKYAQPGQDAKEVGSVMNVANQTYAKIGFMQKGDAISGGTKIEYHSSLILMLKRIKVLTKTVKGQLTKVGIITRATVSKNHLSQGATSVHQLDFQVTASGVSISEMEVEDEDDDQ
jgi:RecA/RadA recombinase